MFLFLVYYESRCSKFIHQIELFVCLELFHREIYVEIFANTFQQIHISRRCHSEIHIALKYSEPCRATLLTVNWEQMAHGTDN
jgi:hypothetical protein